MTARAELVPPTPCEEACEELVSRIRHFAIEAHREHRVAEEQQISRESFLRIVALYFENKSLADWCRDLGILDATDPSEKTP